MTRFAAVSNLFAAAAVAAVATLALPAVGQNSSMAPAATANMAPEYRLGSGDVIRITVYQNPDLTLEARVSEAGTVSYPLLGTVRIGSLTLPQAEQLIADGLRKGNFVKQPQVSVLVLQVRGHQASVLGQVNRPGRYPLETGDLRLSDLLAIAGGVAPNGAEIVTIVGRRNGQAFRQEVDLPTVFRTEQRENDVPVLNGDVVYVDRAPMVYIYGEVQRPGAMRLERGMTLMQALATGGGLTQRGTEKGIRVHRKGANGQVEIVRPSLDDRVQDGDVVYVRESLF